MQPTQWDYCIARELKSSGAGVEGGEEDWDVLVIRGLACGHQNLQEGLQCMPLAIMVSK